MPGDQLTWNPFTITLVVSVLGGIVLLNKLGIKDVEILAVIFSSSWPLYAVGFLVTVFLVKPGLRIEASRQDEITIVRWELRNTKGRDGRE